MCAVLIPKQRCLVHSGWWVRLLSEWLEGGNKASVSIHEQTPLLFTLGSPGLWQNQAGNSEVLTLSLGRSSQKTQPLSSGPTCHLWPQTEVLCLYHNIEPTLHKLGMLVLWSFNRAIQDIGATERSEPPTPFPGNTFAPLLLRFVTWKCKVLWTRA